jgi:hypothetical protein
MPNHGERHLRQIDEVTQLDMEMKHTAKPMFADMSSGK